MGSFSFVGGEHATVSGFIVLLVRVTSTRRIQLALRPCSNPDEIRGNSGTREKTHRSRDAEQRPRPGPRPMKTSARRETLSLSSSKTSAHHRRDEMPSMPLALPCTTTTPPKGPLALLLSTAAEKGRVVYPVPGPGPFPPPRTQPPLL